MRRLASIRAVEIRQVRRARIDREQRQPARVARRVACLLPEQAFRPITPDCRVPTGPAFVSPAALDFL